MKALLSGFLTSNLGELQLKMGNIQVIPSHAVQTEMWRKLAELSLKNNDVPFWGSLAH
jgi:hypothetical protein